MNTKPMRLALTVLGLNSCIMCNAENVAHLLQTNSDWHITSESFSNTPFWLVPNDVPARFTPLKNGQWVWTTNMELSDDSIVTDAQIDMDKLVHQVWPQEKQRLMNDIDPPGIAHIPFYRDTWHGKYHWETNVALNWQGVWVEDTNTRWRVALRLWRTNTPDMAMTVHVGSIVTNSGVGLLPPPDGRYAKLELFDANGKKVPTKWGAARNLYRSQYGGYSERDLVEVADNLHLPSVFDATVQGDYPDTISDLEYPRAKRAFSRSEKGGFVEISTGFVSNGPTCHIGFIKFNDIFAIKTEGDYTLTVQPVLYRMHYDGGTFQGYLDRLDLPSVTTKVHLTASPGN